jgi:phosphomannomutase
MQANTGFSQFSAGLATEFNRLNRAILVADEPQSWQPAIKAMNAFLAQLETWLAENPAVIGEDIVTSSRIFSLLLTLAATGTQGRLELYQAKDDATKAMRAQIDEEYLPRSGDMRRKAIAIAREYLQSSVFASLSEDIRYEILPLLESLDDNQDPDRFMAYRVIQIGNIFERLFALRLRTGDSVLLGLAGKKGLLREIYDRKYLRFGTSGVRGRWGFDFTETRARQVVQAVCDFLNDENVPSFVGAEDLSGKVVVLGHDTRRNSDLVTQWTAETCLANGFKVHIGTRDVPTPALVFYETEVVPPDAVAGLIIATASHNPPEWQGIKFNPRLGYPAPTNVTDFIAFRINELQLIDHTGGQSDLENARARGLVQGFDPLDDYVKWIKNNGKGNARIPIDFDRIRHFFADKMVVVDEMHGSGRGYLTRLLGEAGVRFTVIHANVDPDLGGQDYANPEEPFNQLLKETVAQTGAQIGMGMDTDADRFGIVDKGGVYFRPNQILPMLLRYLGVDRGITGRVIATQTGSPLLEVLAGMIPNNDANKPAKGALPGYVGQRIYKCRVGDIASRSLQNAFAVPVGIKYIEEIRRTDAAYNNLKILPDDWRDRILIGGEESSGLTTRGHITDKDGPWANLLILDMLAYYGTRAEKPLGTLQEIWDELVNLPGLWHSFGTSSDPTSHAGRSDVDAPLEAKEAFIDYYLDLPEHPGADGLKVAGLNIVYLGGIRYELVEMQLSDQSGNDHYYLRMRASGTEPINRVYIEAADLQVGQRMMAEVLKKLEDITADTLRKAHSPWHLVDMLCQSRLSDRTEQAVREVISRQQWSIADILAKIDLMTQTLEKRNRKVIQAWHKALSA